MTCAEIQQQLERLVAGVKGIRGEHVYHLRYTLDAALGHARSAARVEACAHEEAAPLADRDHSGAIWKTQCMHCGITLKTEERTAAPACW